MLSKKFKSVKDKALFCTIAVIVYNLFSGLLLGNLAGTVNRLESNADVTDGVFGDILIAAAVGSTMALLFVDEVNHEIGTGVACICGTLCYLITVPLLAESSSSYRSLFVASWIVFGFTIVLMNATLTGQNLLVNKVYNYSVAGKALMFFPAGEFVGSLCGGALLQAGFSLVDEYALISGIAGLFLLIAFFGFYTLEEEVLIENSAYLENCKTVSKEQFLAETAAVLEAAELAAEKVAKGHYKMLALSKQRTYSTFDMSVADLTAARSEATASDEDEESLGDSSSSADNEFDPLIAQQTLMQRIHHEQHRSKVRGQRELRSLIYCSAIIALFFFILGGVTFWSTSYFQRFWGVSDFLASFAYASFTLSITLIDFFTDALINSLGEKFVLLCGALTSLLGFIMIEVSYYAGYHSTTASQVVTLIGFAFVGLGFGPVQTTVNVYVGRFKTIPVSDAAAVIVAAAYSGMFLSNIILGNISDYAGGLNSAFLAMGVAVFMAGIIAIGLSKRKTAVVNKQNLSRTVTAEDGNTVATSPLTA
jgi:predicted MFS family arabinose efflux permease